MVSRNFQFLKPNCDDLQKSISPRLSLRRRLRLLICVGGGVYDSSVPPESPFDPTTDKTMTAKNPCHSRKEFSLGIRFQDVSSRPSA